MNKNTGKIFVVSGPAGTGKSTLVRMLTQEFDHVVESVSYTTRKPRPNEIDGIDYFFVTHHEFEKKIASGEILEHVKLYGHYYGTSRNWVEQQIDAGKYAILTIDTQGAKMVQSHFPIITICVEPPSLEALRERLNHRKTESERSKQDRLDYAQGELEAAKNYNYHIINDDLSHAYQALKTIVVE